MTLQRVTLKDQIKQELLSRILSGAYKPGERLIEIKSLKRWVPVKLLSERRFANSRTCA
jgi:DNA-binding GntR family transcriptional regulator